MSEKLKHTLPRYGITAAIGGLLAWLFLELNGYALASTPVEKYRLLCDAFTIPGVVLIMVGVLVLIANQGTFDGLSFALSSFFKALIPFSKKEHIRYYDYVEKKRQKGRVKGYSFLFFTGLGFLAVAMIFMALFYSVY